ncbi:MAG TPA: SpoIIE family protein phosphatase [Polyangia bacterium]
MRRGTLSRWNLFVERLSERLGKSSRVFLIGLLVACGIEVAVDWNSTLYEVNVLRGSLKQKGEDYVDILRRAAQPAVEAYDWDALDELSRGLFEDEDVVYVRFSDALGNTLHDRVRADYAAAYLKRHGVSFRDHYRHQIERDAGGMMTDPLKLRDRIAQSRHRDFIQAFTDSETRLFARFSAPPPPHEPPPMVLYQDRLYDDERQLDRGLSYALGIIATERGDATGIALVAFRHDRMNRAVIGKLLKGLAITLFFVFLILVQNVLSRRAKLRLLDLEAALSAARAAIRSSTPETPAYGAGQLGVAFAQADRLGGTVYDLHARDDGSIDLLLAVPAGTGVDAAFASIVLRDLYRRQGRAMPPAARVTALLGDYDASPLSRDVEILCAHFGADGAVSGVLAGLRPPVLIDGAGALHEVELGAAVTSTARRLAAPLQPFHCSLADGTFALFDDGMAPAADRRLDRTAALARIADRLTRRHEDPQTAAEDIVAEAVKRYRKRHSDDFFALVARASARSG